MEIYSSLITFAGEDCILLTDENARPVLILKRYQIDKLIKEWNNK